MKEYICGIKINAEDSNTALQHVMPAPRLIDKILISGSINCIESPSVGVDFVVFALILVFTVSIVSGFFLGKNK